jgi:Protein of unknown function (DUF3108)
MKLSPTGSVVAAGAALLLLWCSLAGGADNHLPFAAGETLTYNVNWSVFPAGRVVVEFFGHDKKPGGSYKVKTSAQSSGFVSVLYKVHDEFESSFGPQTICSHRIAKSVNEGRRHKETEIHFDYARGMAILDERDPSKQDAPAKHAENGIPACVQDVVSAFYYLRAQPLEVGQSVKLAVNDGGETSEVVVEVQRREQIQTGVGNRTALRVEPKVFGKLFKKKGRMLIWLSDDPQRLPLRIKMVLPIGSIVGTLASVTSATENAP